MVYKLFSSNRFNGFGCQYLFRRRTCWFSQELYLGNSCTNGCKNWKGWWWYLSDRTGRRGRYGRYGYPRSVYAGTDERWQQYHFADGCQLLLTAGNHLGRFAGQTCRIQSVFRFDHYLRFWWPAGSFRAGNDFRMDHRQWRRWFCGSGSGCGHQLGEWKLGKVWHLWFRLYADIPLHLTGYVRDSGRTVWNLRLVDGCGGNGW